jgi:hypothetical protein
MTVTTALRVRGGVTSQSFTKIAENLKFYLEIKIGHLRILKSFRKFPFTKFMNDPPIKFHFIHRHFVLLGKISCVLAENKSIENSSHFVLFYVHVLP